MTTVDEPRDDREDDFLAFWDDHRAKTGPEPVYKRILGVDVEVPTDLPLGVEDLAAELQASSNPDDIARLVEMIFGADVYGRWKANGLKVKMLPIIFYWGMANGSGKATTFDEAAELVAKAEADREGKAPAANRAARRASSATRASGAAGRSSSPTSAASTSSPRKKSRA